MKRTYILIVISLLTLTACHHKDGELDSRRHLEYVFASSSAVEDGVTLYDYPLHQVQAWIWDKDELYRIDYTENETTFSENLFYDSKHRLMRTTVPAYGLRSELCYAGRDLEAIHVYEDDGLQFSYLFTHEKGLITSVQQNFYDGRPGVTYTLRWSHDNVTYVKRVCGSESEEMRYSYDDQRNPQRDLYCLFALHEEFDPVMMSKNNVVEKVCAFEGNPSYTFTYTYEYDGRYPITRHVTYTRTSMNHITFEPSTVTVSETRAYQYE